MYFKKSNSIAVIAAITASVLSQQISQDPGTGGVSIEVVHLYSNEYPQGIAVSSTGRMFSNYARSLDPNNIAYTVAELTGNNTETPYPSVAINSPPGGAINYTTNPATGANYENYLIGVQSVVIDPLDRLWILDTGRAAMPNGTNVYASVGGPKLIGVNLSNNTMFKTIVFPPNVVYPDSYINDIRFDLRPNVTASGHGVGYITDSSQEGRNGIIVVDLGTGKSWRHLDGTSYVHPETGFLPVIWGNTVYSLPNGPTMPISQSTFGADGIALSADGATLYFSAVGSRYLYSVPTARLLDDSLTSELMATQAVVSHGQKGISDGLETDTNGFIYGGNQEDNSIIFFNPANGTVNVFARDPRMSWTDTLSVASDGYIYFTENQLWRTTMFYPGTDRRIKPYVLFRAKLPGNGTKVNLS
ncbi:hypothetical protein HO133_007440 [Letharia lupina]|uniref:Major royal jelly protein n=1 Tax=Letharia lupina TaxID=560253 RepID=A0A8H6FIV9_9LECA|nr:uncharacterized protein HO133_007440 [Letharia lupina]KAF6229324.1 hypothetical protein HO133_007440 [Letharia lupina]